MTNDKGKESLVAGEVSLAEKVHFLKLPGSYPYPVRKVETRETHMSWIFLTEDIVYKLKKPVTYRFLDFSTLDARLKNCQEEMRLNKRLAGYVYLGIIPLVLNKDDKLQIGGDGKIVEWLVKMERIREEYFLDYAIRNGKVKESLVKGVAQLLTEFYIHATPVLIDPELYRNGLHEDIISTQAELFQPVFHFSSQIIERVGGYLARFINDHSILFDNRMAGGKIIESHGDLRPEHICLAPQPAVIDSLEFNRELRIMDIAEELSYLGMECEMMGNENIGRIFLDCYIKCSKDTIPESLILFYKAKKAFLRTYLVARHITESLYKDETKWLRRAGTYLELADKYNSRLCMQVK